LRNTRKVVFIIAAIVAAGMVIWLVTQDWDQRRIRKNLNRLAAVAFKPRGTAIEGIDLFKRVSILKSLFTEDCVISPGEPVPQIRGLDELSALFTQGINMVAELKVLFKDVSVSIAPGRTGATATMTAEGIGTDLQGGGRQFEAREIEMAWNKVGGKWKIASVKEVKTLH
jgi:hypothetical protein